MESKLIGRYGAWEYTSKSGLKYTIGEITADFNVIIDDFEDIVELFDCNIWVYSHMVSYIFGSIEHCDADEFDDVKRMIDDIIDKYEKHERTIKFQRNVFGRKDWSILYECYIGTETEVDSVATRVTKAELLKMAEEDR